jgi:competence protein ComEA
LFLRVESSQISSVIAVASEILRDAERDWQVHQGTCFAFPRRPVKYSFPPHGDEMKRDQRKRFAYHDLYLSTFLCVGLGTLAFENLTIASASVGQTTAGDHPAAHPEFPPGDGRETTLRLCGKCHSPTIVLAYGQKREGWENTITKMVRLGAVGSDEDFTDIADYLTANFPPSAIPKIFVNKATDQQFANILGISIDDAKAIVAYRDKIGSFKSIDDMKLVPNVDVKKIDAKKDNLVF